MRAETAMPTFSQRQPALKDRRILVAGLGKSGMSSARLLATKGAHVLASDLRSDDQLGQNAADLKAIGAELHTGRHPDAALATSVDLIVLSPGVPASLGWLQAVRDARIPVWGEIDPQFQRQPVCSTAITRRL